MEHPDDHDLVRLHKVEDTVGKPTKESTAKGAMDAWMSQGVAGDLGEARIKRAPELGREILTLFPIPSADLSDVVLVCRAEPDGHVSSSRDSRTSSHVRPAPGLAR